MRAIFDFLESIFFTNFVGGVNLYTILSTVLKFVFVIIVLYFVYMIVKMIYLDIRSSTKTEAVANTYLKLINRTDRLQFPVRETYYIADNTTIGRGESNNIIIKDRLLSKDHARIVHEDGRFFLDDLGSTNGTYVNEERVEHPTQLHDKDIIGLGELEFLFVNGEQNEK